LDAEIALRRFTVTVIVLTVSAVFFAHRARAQNSHTPTVQTEIAEVEARVDAHESEALNEAGQAYSDAPGAVVVLRKVCSSTRISQ
jgi:hypothetical protein